MYFSQQAHNVKKHHALCHNKVLECPHCTDFSSTSQVRDLLSYISRTENNVESIIVLSFQNHDGFGKYNLGATFRYSRIPNKRTGPLVKMAGKILRRLAD